MGLCQVWKQFFYNDIIQEIAAASEIETEQQEEIPDELLNSNFHFKHIAAGCAKGLNTNDDNKTAPRKLLDAAMAVIKKHQYWPKHVPGRKMDSQMEDNKTGNTNSLKGFLGNEPYDMFCMTVLSSKLSMYGSLL